jgi:hypothetical protein
MYFPDALRQEPMPTLKHLLSAGVIFALVASGLPVFNSHDASRNSAVDLEDAILNLKDLVQGSESSGEFVLEAGNVISTLRILAGLKADLRPAADEKSKSSQVGGELVYLLPFSNSSTYRQTCSFVNESSVSYESVAAKPDTPPPKAV